MHYITFYENIKKKSSLNLWYAKSKSVVFLCVGRLNRPHLFIELLNLVGFETDSLKFKKQKYIYI